MDIDILDKKIRRLALKLKKYNILLEIFEEEDIKYGHLLGRGGEGTVYYCTVTYNNIPVEAALKTISANTEDSISLTLDEIELLCLGWDPIIDTTIKVYGVAAIPNKKNPEVGELAIVTEIGVMNALQLYQQETLPITVTLDFWSRLSAAIYTLHHKKIIHQDLKPENILITNLVRDSCGSIRKIEFKIIDLGMAQRVYTDKIVTDDILGTVGYHAPEVLFEECHDFRADIFTLGITFAVILLPKIFLVSSTLKSILRSIHTAKKNGIRGQDLLNVIFSEDIVKMQQKDICDNLSVLSPMIATMLESQEKRNIDLLDVINICRENVNYLKENCSSDLPSLTVYRQRHSDSGFTSTSMSSELDRSNVENRTPRSADCSRRITRSLSKCSSINKNLSNLTFQKSRRRLSLQPKNLLEHSKLCPEPSAGKIFEGRVLRNRNVPLSVSDFK